MATQKIYAEQFVGITELKRKDTTFIENLSEITAVLKRDSVKAYLVPTSIMETIVEALDDIFLTKTVNQRLKDLRQGKTATVKVNIDEL